MKISGLVKNIATLALLCFSSAALAAGEEGPTVLVGGPGGSSFQDRCEDGYFLVGFAASAGKDLNQIRGLCQQFDAQGRALSRPYDMSTWGKPATGAFNFIPSSDNCPGSTAVEQISVETSNANLVHRFRLTCRNPLKHDYVSTKWALTMGGAAKTSQTIGCGGGAIAIGLIGRQGDAIDALGLLCKVIAAPAGPAVDTTPPVAKITGIMLESKDAPGMFMRHKDFKLGLSKLTAPLDYQDANFTSGPALTRQGRTAVSFESVNFPGFYIRHDGSSLVLQRNDGSQQFAQDASFTQIRRTGGGTVFESVNAPGSFIQRQGFRLVLGSGTAASFDIEAPSGPPATPPIEVGNGGNGDDGNNGDDQPPPNNGGGQASAATDTTIYDQPQGNDVDYLSAGDPVTIVQCNDNNWCQVSKPRKGWVWGDDLNH